MATKSTNSACQPPCSVSSSSSEGRKPSSASSLSPLLLCSFGSSLPPEILKVYSKVFYRRSNEVYGRGSLASSNDRGLPSCGAVADSLDVCSKRGQANGQQTEDRQGRERQGEGAKPQNGNPELPGVFSCSPIAADRNRSKHNLNSRFSENLSKAGMYKAHGLTTTLDKERYVRGPQDWRLRNW